MNIIEAINKILADVKPILCKDKGKNRVGVIEYTPLKSCADCEHGHYKCMPFGDDYISSYYSCDVRNIAVEVLEANNCDDYKNKHHKDEE